MEFHPFERTNSLIKIQTTTHWKATIVSGIDISSSSFSYPKYHSSLQSLAPSLAPSLWKGKQTHPSTFPSQHVSLDNYAHVAISHFIFSFAIVLYFYSYLLLIILFTDILEPRENQFHTISSLNNTVCVQHAHQIYYIIISILHYDNLTSL